MTAISNFPDFPSYHGPSADGDGTIEAFRWLLILGFPASIAAARLMPDVFTDALNEAVEVARRVTRNPFGRER
jgi:hypothetical protein